MRQGEIDDVHNSIKLSKAIMRKIKMNFLWACGYNIIFIPLAMGMFLPWNIHLHPMMAGLAMACSSVSVVVNSLTLKLWRKPKLEDYEKVTYGFTDRLNKIWDIITIRPLKLQKSGYETIPVEMSNA